MKRTARDRIIDALRDLPADAGVDEAIERLVLLARIEAVFSNSIGARASHMKR